MMMKIMGRIMRLGLGWYHNSFLAVMAIEQYDAHGTKTIEELAKIAMEEMPQIGKESKGKKIMPTSTAKSLERLEEELHDSSGVTEKLLRGDVVRNVLDFLLAE